MIRILQINVGTRGAAQDLMVQTGRSTNTDIIVVSEQNRNGCEEEGWFSDKGSKSAIYILNSDLAIDIIGPPEDIGFRWIQTHGIRFYCCYFSPNKTIQEFQDYMDKLGASIAQARVPVVVAGDFNSHARAWGSPADDARGDALLDLAASLDMVVSNQGTAPTFTRGASATHIDLTLVSSSIASRIENWKVLEEESLSLHHYITYEVRDNALAGPSSRVVGWAVRKLDKERLCLELGNDIARVGRTASVEQDSENLGEWLHKAADASMPRRGLRRQKNAVYWWSEEIGVLRKAHLRSRRVYQKKRKKYGEDLCSEEHEAYRRTNVILVNAIRKAKEGSWIELLNAVEADPWGLPYRVVTKKLHRRRPIPGIDLPGRLNMILSTLFPTEDLAAPEAEMEVDGAAAMAITNSELREAAKSLPNNKCPGPDGLPNEVIKVAVMKQSEAFLGLFNRCLEEGIYPEVWKVADLVLLPKVGKKLDDPSAYRPICMLNTTGKLLEKILVGRLRRHMETNNLFSNNQFGFRRGRSTLDAHDRLLEIIRQANQHGIAYNDMVSVLTLDVKNAFNSVPRSKIMEAMRGKRVPGHLIKIIGSYLSDRRIRFSTGNGVEEEISTNMGVPQGSVLGPQLWNIMYDGLLRVEMPEGVEVIAFADDVALVARAPVAYALEERLQEALGKVVEWMTAHGLQLAMEKAEVVVFTKRKKYNQITIHWEGHTIRSKSHLKYLGVIFDSRLTFKAHAEFAAARASTAASQLARLMPNVGGPGQWTRKLLSAVVTSKIMYASSTWSPTLGAAGMKIMERAYRRTRLRVSSCYRTVSGEAAAVISSMPPIHLLAEERLAVRKGADRKTAHEAMLRRWQHEWDRASNGRFTYRMVPVIAKWIGRKFGEVDFHLSQLLSGHGCFGSYLKRFHLRTDESCIICGSTPDDVEHAILGCDAGYNWRWEIWQDLGVAEPPLEDLVQMMLSNEGTWTGIANYIRRIMKTREKEERRIQMLPNP